MHMPPMMTGLASRYLDFRSCLLFPSTYSIIILGMTNQPDTGDPKYAARISDLQMRGFEYTLTLAEMTEQECLDAFGHSKEEMRYSIPERFGDPTPGRIEQRKAQLELKIQLCG